MIGPRRPWVLTVLIAGGLLCGPSPLRAQVTPAPPTVEVDDGTGVIVHAAGGGVVGAVAEANGVKPFAYVSVDAPVADSDFAPRLQVESALTLQHGKRLRTLDPAMWRAVEANLGLAQPIARALHFDLYGELGFSSKLNAEVEQPTSRWAYGGLRFRGKRGFLRVGAGADQRLAGFYRPALEVVGAVSLLRTNKKPRMWMVSSNVLSLDAPVGPSDLGRILVRIGVAVGL